MHLLEKIEHWGESHHPWWIDIFRAGLGLILIVKGIHIISNAMTTLSDVENPDIIYAAFILIHFIAVAHISGGILITIGLMTRFAILIQLPVILSALIIVNFPGRLNFEETETELILLVLLLLFLFFVEGPGKYSVDDYINNHPE